MRLLEHESKELLAEAGVPVPRSRVTASPDEASAFARELGGPVVLKAQVPVGGRQRAGGVIFVSRPESVASAAAKLLGREVRGYAVDCLLVQERVDARQSLYLAVTYDTAARQAVVLASAQGGVDVEEQAGTVGRFPFSLRVPFPDYRAREIAGALGFTGGPVRKLAPIIARLADVFLRHDALLVEVNPLLLTAGGEFVAVDAHVELDDEALFRHRELVERWGLTGRGARPQTEFEQRAAEIDRADHRGVAGRMVQFDGDLGLLIGGGGASLASFDAVLDAGLRPANYCEIGGNPSVWKVRELTRLILSQPQVERLAVIMNVVSNTRVDLVARGVIKGILELGRDPQDVLVAFRVPGSWEEEGFALLERYGVPYFGRETAIDEVVATIARAVQ